MSKAVLLFNPQSDDAILSGGGWLSGDTALSNIQNDRYWRVARSTTSSPMHTQFNLDCRRVRTVSGFACIIPNATTGCRVRVSAYADENHTTAIYQSAFIHGGQTSGEWEDDERAPIFSLVFPQRITARYWHVEIIDLDNFHGYVEVARFFLAEGLSPSFSNAFGATLGFKNNSLASSTLSGDTVYWRRVNPRQWQCAFRNLPDDELFGPVYDFIRYVGFNREVFVIPDPDDVSHAQQRRFFGTIAQMDAITQAMIGIGDFGFTIEERVALAASDPQFAIIPSDRLVIRDYAPIISTGALVLVPVDALEITDFVPIIASGVNVEVPADVLEITDYVPAVAAGVSLDVPADELMIQNYAPQVASGANVFVPADALEVGDFAPTVVSGANAEVPTDMLEIWDFVPQIAAGVFIAVPTDETEVEDYAPAVAGGASVFAPADDGLEIEDFAPVVVSGVNIEVPYDRLRIMDFAPPDGTGVFIELPEADRAKISDYAPVIATGVNVFVPADLLEITDHSPADLSGFDAGFDEGFY